MNKRFLMSFLVMAALLSSVEFRAIVITKGPIAKEGDFSEAEGIVSDIPLQDGLERFLGTEISKETLRDLKQMIYCLLERDGEFGLPIRFPEQDISNGVIHLQIDPSIVRSVKVQGNCWENSRYYERQFSLLPGDPLETAPLLNRIAWFNRSPFQQAEVILTPTGQNREVDVEFLVKDRFALRPFAGADNTGTDLTSQVRLFAGVNWGKAFGRSDLLTYQYTTAPNPHEFYAHTASYLVFLPWRHELTVYGGFSAIHPDIPHFSHEGISVQASLRYAIPIGPLYRPTKQAFTWGLDYKNMNSNVFFIEVSPAIPVVAQQANVSQIYLAYAWENRILFKAEVLVSPWRWLPHQSDARYDMLRPHSQPQYIYGRLALSDLYGNWDKGSFSWLLRAQGASGPLLPSEQFSLGGYDTVRGYKERDFLADNAICINLEARAPRLTPLRKGELIFLGFTDFGAGYNFQSEQSSQTKQFLWSAGLGVRYNWASYLQIRADYGFQLHHIFGQNTLGRFNLGGSISY
jgi:hemolysin activation/secretion protein